MIRLWINVIQSGMIGGYLFGTHIHYQWRIKISLGAHTQEVRKKPIIWQDFY